MDKTEKLNLIKKCINKIEKDVEELNTDSKQYIINKNINVCLKLIASIITETETPDIKENKSEPSLQPNIMEKATINDISAEMKRLYGIPISLITINEWLINNGMLKINNRNQKVATPEGEKIGINTQFRSYQNKPPLASNYYSENAQRYIYNHADELYALRNDDFTPRKLGLTENAKTMFITPEQKSNLQITGEAKIFDMANEINRVTEHNNTQKINRVWITNWLISIGAVEKNADGTKIPTQYGNKIGIFTREQTSQKDGSKFFQIFCSENAQHFIYDNIESIISYNYEEIKRRAGNK